MDGGTLLSNTPQELVEDYGFKIGHARGVLRKMKALSSSDIPQQAVTAVSNQVPMGVAGEGVVDGQAEYAFKYVGPTPEEQRMLM